MEKIIQGKVSKRLSELCLLSQVNCIYLKYTHIKVYMFGCMCICFYKLWRRVYKGKLVRDSQNSVYLN
jgi:hypothetical protein